MKTYLTVQMIFFHVVLAGCVAPKVESNQEQAVEHSINDVPKRLISGAEWVDMRTDADNTRFVQAGRLPAMVYESYQGRYVPPDVANVAALSIESWGDPDIPVEGKALAECIRSATALQWLKLDGQELDDDVMAALSSKSKLRGLALKDCTISADIGTIKKVFAALGELRFIYIEGDTIRNVNICTIARASKGLLQLDVSHVPDFGTEELIGVCNLPRLKSVILSEWQPINYDLVAVSVVGPIPDIFVCTL